MLASKDLNTIHLGQKIILIGLFVQIAFFGFFVVVSVSFNRAINKRPTSRSTDPTISWRKHLRALYLASILIMIRSIYRCVEYIQGNSGFIIRHEFFIYILDGVPMFFVMAIFNVIHPSEINALLKGGLMAKGFKLYPLQVPV